jgi:hypothetical protein
VKQNGKFTAGCVVSIDGWRLLTAIAKQWRSHGSDLQIIGGSSFNGNLRRARLAQGVGRWPVLKAPCCLRRSRAPGKKRETCCGGAHANPDEFLGFMRFTGRLGSSVIIEAS